MQLHCASQGAALPCHETDDAHLVQRMREVGKTKAEEELDWKELQAERESDDRHAICRD